jgi:hypothetical protein
VPRREHVVMRPIDGTAPQPAPHFAPEAVVAWLPNKRRKPTRCIVPPTIHETGPRQKIDCSRLDYPAAGYSKYKRPTRLRLLYQTLLDMLSSL